jgi:hypothetical protein
MKYHNKYSFRSIAFLLNFLKLLSAKKFSRATYAK